MIRRNETDQIERELQRVGDVVSGQHTKKGIAFLIWVSILYFLAFYLIDYFTRVPYPVRLIVVLGGLSYAVYWFIKNPRKKSSVHLTPEQVSLMVEDKYPVLASRLISTLQFQSSPKLDPGISSGLVSGMIDQTFAELKNIKFKTIVDQRWVKMSLLYILGTSVILIATAGLSFRFFSAYLQRLVLPGIEYPTDTKIEKIDFPKIMPEGDPVMIKVIASGVLPKIGTLSVVSEAGFKTELVLKKRNKDSKEYECHLAGLLEKAKMTIYLGDAERGPIELVPIARPKIASVSALITAPEYTGMEDKKSNSANIRALFGSEIELKIESSKELKEMHLIQKDKESILFKKADGKNWAHKIKVDSSFVFTLKLLDTDGLESNKIPEYRITATADKPCRIRIKQPKSVSELASVSSTDLEFEVKDDFKVSQVKIMYLVEEGEEKTSDEGFEEIKEPLSYLELKPDKSTFKYKNLFDLSKIRPKAGQVVKLWIEASDSALPKPHVSKSPEILIPVVTAEEYRFILESRLAEEMEPVSDVIKDVKTSKREIEDLKK